MTLPEFVPLEFIKAIAQLSPNPFLAPLLWQRGHRNLALLPGFLDAAQYVPTPASAFGEPMDRSVLRIKQAITNQELIGLWHNASPDGIAAIALLYDGLGGLLPDRIQIVKSSSREWSIAAIDSLKSQGITLLIACNVGSQNGLDYAKTIGLDVIMIAHHRNDRPNVYAHLNSRYLERDHPFATLPSVAISYKLMEAVLGQEPRQILDLVAIGLLSDYVEFVGETRYLFQISIPQLQAQSNPETATRPGILKLLTHCKNRGDRPTDFNSGLGSRIRAFSQIQPDRCLDLLIGSDNSETIADQAELAHIRLLALHQEVLDQALTMIRGLDLSMHGAIVLANAQWSFNALPSVANAIAEQYKKAVFLFSTEELGIANGVGRFPFREALPTDFDLYSLLQSQQHLLLRSNGHPNALNLSLASEDLELFTQAIQHQLRLLASSNQSIPTNPDLCVTVAELGETLFKALRSVEPCGLNNPPPQLLLKNVRFDHPVMRKLKDHHHQTVIYRCTQFKLCDRTHTTGIYGNWWGHGQDELPQGDCDAIVQLENNVQKHRYEVRLLQYFPVSDRPSIPPSNQHPILDYRHLSAPINPNGVRLTTCPNNWNILQTAYRRSILAQQPLILDYRLPMESDFATLLGIAKYLARTQKSVSPQQWCDRLSVSASTLQIGLEALQKLGFEIKTTKQGLAVSREATGSPLSEILAAAAEAWERGVCHERFRQQYFMQVKLAVLQAFLSQSLLSVAATGTTLWENETSRKPVYLP